VLQVVDLGVRRYLPPATTYAVGSEAGGSALGMAPQVTARHLWSLTPRTSQPHG